MTEQGKRKGKESSDGRGMRWTSIAAHEAELRAPALFCVSLADGALGGSPCVCVCVQLLASSTRKAPTRPLALRLLRMARRRGEWVHSSFFQLAASLVEPEERGVCTPGRPRASACASRGRPVMRWSSFCFFCRLLL